MRTRREVAVRDQTWVTSNPREKQGSRGTQSELDRGGHPSENLHLPSPPANGSFLSLVLLCVSSVSMRLVCDLALVSVCLSICFCE